MMLQNHAYKYLLNDKFSNTRKILTGLLDHQFTISIQ
jgi:hypothetical protein